MARYGNGNGRLSATRPVDWAEALRRAAKVDANQTEIIRAYRRMGCKVYPTHMVGGDFPDLVVCKYGLTWTCEIKSGNNKPSEGQMDFAENCQGSHFIVRDLGGVELSVAAMRDKAERMRP